MPPESADSRSRNEPARLAAVLGLILLLLLGYCAVRAIIARGDEPAELFLEPPETEQTRCVWNMEADEMRLQHWERLRKIREDVVRYGIRDQDGLSRCKDCHRSRARFCDRCHNAVSLTPDCWQCHDYPE
ncbi:MAG: hypothetical protein HQ581_03750 [Planctomycetes bacterium]|nr:hypothetical protein [Planctomycetota bacterium]